VTKSLLWKLLGINILTIGFVIVIMWLAIDYLAADYFMVLMKKYNISPTETHQMFLDAVHRYLIWASLGALVLVLILSFLLMKKVLGPLTRMTDITGKIASGDYSDKVSITSRDEVGQLAVAFNRMADSLQKIERLRKTMVIDVAHELRTPLTNIQGYLEALTDGVGGHSPPSKSGCGEGHHL
jgi:signal transduction histidine kinase